MKKIAIITLLTLLSGITIAQANFQAPSYWEQVLGTNYITTNPSTLEVGSVANPLTKIYAQNFDVAGLFTFGGTMMSNLDMNGYDLTNAKNISATGTVTGSNLYYINDLNSSASGSGSALLGVYDAGSYYSSSNLESILQQVGATAGASSGTTWQDPVIDKDLGTPPVSPTEGDRYIVAQADNWYDASWTYKREITIDKDKVPANQSDFVVYFAINAPDGVFTNANSDGSDILFTESDGKTLLPFDLELYDSNTENMTAWVRMDLSSTVDTTFYMYYGNSYATSASDAIDTWSDWGSATTIFDAVYQMDASAEDSTINNYDFKVSDFVGSPVSGSGTYGYKFQGNGSSGWKTITQPTIWGTEFNSRSFVYLITTPSVITSTKQVLYSAGGTANGVVIYLDGNGVTQNLYTRWWSSTWAGGYKVSSNVNASTTYLLNSQYDYGSENQYTLYLNGVEQNTPAGTTTTKQSAHSKSGGLGMNTGSKIFHDGTFSSPYYYAGDVHQMWILNDFFTANWNTTLSNNLVDYSNFLSVGVELTGGATGAWAGHEQEIAEWTSGAWVFDVANAGWAVIVVDEGLQYTYNSGGVWSPLTSSLGHDYLSSITGCDAVSGVCYHLSSTEHSSATRDATDTLNGLMPSGKLTNWNSAYNYLISRFGLDGGSYAYVDAQEYTMTGSGATTTGTGSTNNNIVFDTRGDYPLDNGILYFDTAQENYATLSGTALVFNTYGSYHIQLGGAGGCSDTSGRDDVCISGVAQIIDRAKIGGNLEAEGDILGSRQLSIAGTGVISGRLQANSGIETGGGTANAFNNPSNFSQNIQVTGTGTFNGRLQANSGIETSGGTANSFGNTTSFIASVSFSDNARFEDGKILRWGSSNDSGLVWDTAQTENSLVMGLGASNTLILTGYGKIGSNWAVPPSPEPQLVFTGNSSVLSEVGYLKYDGAVGGVKLQAGSGNIALQPGMGGIVGIASGYPLSFTNPLRSNSLYIEGDAEVDGNFYADSNATIAGTGTFSGAMVYKFANVNSATYTVLPTDRFLGVSYTATGTGTITIPSDFISVAGWSIDIKDSGFNSSVYPVIIETEGAQTIDGNANLSITADGSAYTLISDGTNLLIY